MNLNLMSTLISRHSIYSFFAVAKIAVCFNIECEGCHLKTSWMHVNIHSGQTSCDDVVTKYEGT